MLLIQVDNLIIPPASTPGDYLAQLESDGLGEEDLAVLKEMRADNGDGDPSEGPEAGGVPPQLIHLFKKHFRQGRFLIATMSEAAAARVIRDLGFAAFLNAPAAFISMIAVRDVDQMAVMQASALTDWFAEVDTPVGKIYGLHYPSSWINMPAPVEDAEEHGVSAILKKIMLNSSPMVSTDRHFPEMHGDLRWLTPKTELRVEFADGEQMDGSAAVDIANSVTERLLAIRRISGGDLFLAETCRPLFPDFFL
jgi:hypothetical protein